jgi:coproporphyrinogen III oxidase-like Fe-S oxidoreductase
MSLYLFGNISDREKRMFVIESFLNRFYRKKMKSVLEFDNVDTISIPRKQKNDKEDYLLYIHIPFCESLCPYCSFHREVFEEDLAHRYFTALWEELKMYKALDYDFKGLYIGGGTPTIMVDLLLTTMNVAKKHFSLQEVSVETNPNHLTEENLHLLKSAGVNRLSVGVQSFDDQVLKGIKRYERYGSGAQIIQRLENAMGKFETLNVDLIFNIPIQTRESLKKDLDIIDDLLPEQVTFYPLMSAAAVESALENSLGNLDYRKEKNFYFMILERMKKDYTGSTAWCFSRGSSMIDEYVIVYDKYVGAGSGAFGYFNDCIYANTFSVQEYIDRINDHQFPIARVKKFTKKENMYYFLLMKLFGLSVNRKAFREKFGESLDNLLWKEIALLKISGAIKESGDVIEPTDRGRYYWVMAMREFFIAVDNLRDFCRTRVHQQNDERN